MMIQRNWSKSTLLCFCWANFYSFSVRKSCIRSLILILSELRPHNWVTLKVAAMVSLITSPYLYTEKIYMQILYCGYIHAMNILKHSTLLLRVLPFFLYLQQVHDHRFRSIPQQLRPIPENKITSKLIKTQLHVI